MNSHLILPNQISAVTPDNSNETLQNHAKMLAKKDDTQTQLTTVETILPLTMFDNDRWYPLKLNDTIGIIAYVGLEGVLSIKEFGKKTLGVKYKPYALLNRKNKKNKEDLDVNVNVINDTEKHWLKYYLIIVAVALDMNYIDVCNLNISHRDKNRLNNHISNLRLIGPLSVPTPKSVYMINYSHHLVPPSAESSREKIEAIAKLGINQVLPTKLFESNDLFPLHVDQKSSVILYVGKEGILSVEQYGKKIIGHKYELLKPSLGSDGYMVLNVKKNQKNKEFRINRILAAAALGTTYRDIEGYDVDHKDKNEKNNDINNLQLLTRKDHNDKTMAHSKDSRKGANNFNIKPVEQLDVDGKLLKQFDDLKEAADFCGLSSIHGIKGAIRKKSIYTYKIDGKDVQCKWRFGEFPYLGKIKKLEEATLWYDVIHPDTGKPVPGYRISNNLILQLPSGRFTEGTIKKDVRHTRFILHLGKLKRPDTRVGEASKSGVALTKAQVMAHNDNVYTDVTMSTVRPTTSRGNNIETHGRPVVARYDDPIKGIIEYNSIVEAAEAHHIIPSTLGNAMRVGGAHYSGIRFLYKMNYKRRDNNESNTQLIDPIELPNIVPEETKKTTKIVRKIIHRVI